MSGLIFLSFRYPELFCAGYMLCELMSLEAKNQIAGVTCVVDLTGYSFSHMHSFTWDGIKSSIALLQVSFDNHQMPT